MQIDVDKFREFERKVLPKAKKIQKKLVKFTKNKGFNKIAKIIGEKETLNNPASPRLYYHYGFRGGWILHTRDVLKCAKNYYNIYKNLPDVLISLPGVKDDILSLDFDLDRLMKVALLHDVGKLKGYYKRNDWRRISRGRPFSTARDIVYMPHSSRVLRICMQYDIELEDDEMEAVMLHDGPILDKNKDAFPNVTDLTFILYQADFAALKIERKQFDEYILDSLLYESEDKKEKIDKEEVSKMEKDIENIDKENNKQEKLIDELLNGDDSLGL